MSKKNQASGHPPIPQRANVMGWALDRVSENITFLDKGGSRMIAWYLLDPQMWSFRSVAEGEQLITAHAGQVASLVGSTLYGRITSRPYPVASWARTAWDNSPAPTKGFSRILTRDQELLQGRVQSEKLVFYGVDLGRRSALLARAGRFLDAAARRELEDLRGRLGELDSIMAGPGIEAVPAVGNDMAWMLARSFALGCPLPEQTTAASYEWAQDDLAEFTDSVRWSAEPLAQSVRVDSTVDTVPTTRHVVVLTVGRMASLAIPEDDQPWIAKTDNLPFPVEWSFRVDIRKAEDTSKEMNKLSDRINAQIEHYTQDHGKTPPKQLGRQGVRAREVEDEMRRGFDGLSTRLRGWFRIAVSGTTEEEALARAAKVQELYAPAVKIEREFDQYRLAREFVPGEPLANVGHTRHMPVLKLAAGVPAATAEVGDRRGPLVGFTAGFAESAVMFDPWYGPEVLSQSGLVPVTGGLGSGKTVLAAGIVYKTASQGSMWTVLDPSGRLGALADMAEFRGIAHKANLLNSEPGALNPYALVPVPRRSWFKDEDDPEMRFLLALSAAQAERREIVEDTLLYCVPHDSLSRPGVRDVLRDAIWQAPAEPSSTLSTVLDILQQRSRGEGDDAAAAGLLWRRLSEASERELSRLFFASETSGDRGEESEARRLMVFSLKGLTHPSAEKAPDEWSYQERMSRPILSLAAWSTLRTVYRLDPSERKGVMLDEAHEITAVSSGATLVQKVSTDSRKHDLAALLVTQNASRVLQQGVENFVGAAFVGRTQGEAEQASAAQLLGLPRGVGYEAAFGALSPKSRRNPNARTPREFVFRDGMGGSGGRGGMEKIRVDFTAHPEFMAAVDTTPDKRIRDVAPSDVGSAAELEGAIA